MSDTEKKFKDSAPLRPGVQPGDGKPESSGESGEAVLDLRLVAIDIHNAGFPPLGERVIDAANAIERAAAGNYIRPCDGCDPFTAKEVYALYMMTGEYPAADEVIGTARRKLSHALLEIDNLRELIGEDYYEEWLAERSHRDLAAPAPSGDVSVAEIVSEMRKTVAQATGPGYTGTIFAAVVDRWADALAATNTPPTESVRLEGEVHEFKPSPLSVTQFAPFRSLGAEVVPDDFPIGPVAITITPLGGDDE